MWYWQRARQIFLWIKIDNLETEAHKYAQVTFYKGQKQFNAGSISYHTRYGNNSLSKDQYNEP